MASNEIDLVFWANVVGGTALMFYGYFLWMQARGMINASARLVRIVRGTCFCLLLAPVAARFQFNKDTILVLSIVMLLVALFVKWRRHMGI